MEKCNRILGKHNNNNEKKRRYVYRVHGHDMAYLLFGEYVNCIPGYLKYSNPLFFPMKSVFKKFGRINFCLISNRDGLPSFLLRCYVSSLTCAPGRASVAGGSFRVRARRQSPAQSGSRTACCRHTRPRSSPGASSWAAAVGSSRRWTTRPPDTPG